MPNKFKNSLKQMEANTDVKNQGIEQESTSTLQEQTAEIAIMPPMQTEQTKSSYPEPAPAAIPETNPVPVKPKRETKKNQSSSSFDVSNVLDPLESKNKKGQAVTVYLNWEVDKKLKALMDERKLNKSQIINAILEKTLLGQN